MKNRQAVRAASDAERGGFVTVAQLHQKLASIAPGSTLETSGSRQSVLAGHFYSRQLCPGLGIHCVDAVELLTTWSRGEFAPGLSVNIVLQGRLNFCLGSAVYDVDWDRQPGVVVLKTSANEVFSRKLCQGRQLAKVNVAVSEHWLRERFASQTVAALLRPEVLNRPADRQLIRLATTLMQASLNPAVSPLELEVLALDIVREVLAGLLRPQSQALNASGRTADSLMLQVQPMLRRGAELPDIARALGMSISTLQRKFKAQYGTTVMDYARSQRLELARRALILEGKSVQQAAFLAGYEHTSNFVAAFTKHFAVTPGELIKRHCLT